MYRNEVLSVCLILIVLLFIVRLKSTNTFMSYYDILSKKIGVRVKPNYKLINVFNSFVNYAMLICLILIVLTLIIMILGL